jgi:hypothetical protein
VLSRCVPHHAKLKSSHHFALAFTPLQTPNAGMKIILLAAGIGIALGSLLSPCHAQTPAPGEPPFTSTLSNNFPLAFGMDEATTAAALGTPLTYVSGKPGNEVFMVIRKVNGNGFTFRDDPLYLQFRKGRLTGWKGDWDRRWMW